MTDNNDNSVIDEKHKQMTNKNKNENYTSNIGKFLITILILFAIVITYYISSGLILYACKLGQSNILPTNKHCYPYENTKPNISPSKINIFTDSHNSMKINFPYDEFNSSNKLLDLFREYKNEPNSNFLVNYLISLLSSVIQLNYSMFNYILDNMNTNLNENIIVLFGPIIISILTVFIFIIDNIYLIYLWFANMSWFFKTNVNDSNTGNPKWEDVHMTSPFNYICAIIISVIFAILFLFCFPCLSLVSFISISWCILTCITYNAEMNGQTINAGTIVKDVFKYYKVLIMGISCFFVIISAFSKLGNIPGIISVLTLTLIYFGFISIDIFNPVNKEHMTPLTSYKQSTKTCIFKETKKNNIGFIRSLFQGQTGGNKIINQIKNINKQNTQ